MIPHDLLRKLTAIVVFMSIITNATSSCLAQKTLTWKFKKGGVTNVLIEQDTGIQLEMASGAAAAHLARVRTPSPPSAAT